MPKLRNLHAQHTLYALALCPDPEDALHEIGPGAPTLVNKHSQIHVPVLNSRRQQERPSGLLLHRLRNQTCKVKYTSQFQMHV